MTNWLLDVSPRPTILVLPAGAVNLDEAHAAIELWEHYKRRKLDPTQRLAVEVMMATRADNRWAAATTGREMPRQNGKGDEVEVVELWGLTQRSERILHTIHDAVLLATETQSRLLATIESNPDLRRLKLREWQGTGQQMIEMRNGGQIWYRTRSGGGARGVDEVDRVVLDEAQHVEEEHVAAVTPTLLASANPQLNAMGTGGIAGKSEWWWKQRRRALAGLSAGFGYVGHTAEQIVLVDGKFERTPIDPDDRKNWLLGNPALTRRPELVEFLEEQMRRLGPVLFAREHLGVWDPLAEDLVVRDVKIPAADWSATAISTEVATAHADASYGVAVSYDGRFASLSAGGGDQQRPYMECFEHRPGTGWVPDRLVEIAHKSSHPIGINGHGPAGALVGPIRQAFRDAKPPIPLDRLHELGPMEFKQACGNVYQATIEHRLAHPAEGQGPLDLAAGDASERKLGDAWAWDVRQATIPISPLEAGTIAVALLPLKKPTTKTRVHSF